MSKPITIVYEEFRQDLADVINNSTLPAFIIANVLQSYLMETRAVARKQFEEDKLVYQESENR